MRIKANAFTLNEIVIVMIISVIVIGLSFTVLSLVKKHMYAIEQNLYLNTEFNRLEQALWIDINNYRSIRYSENTLSFESIIDSINYQFDSNCIIRDKDTFNIQLEAKRLYFNGSQITQGKVDGIQLLLAKQYKNQSLFVFKYNDALEFMN
ncbi:hypothetical protein [uncultured Psychroserpens sp.]|uniref:hypothetical protein n=1 Tax=uncultured Psychroserpens sp. TaxID=255436 RepID=UPI00263985C2|nr:hypothetical protein [uncultured Psychroserpens sp.]